MKYVMTRRGKMPSVRPIDEGFGKQWCPNCGQFMGDPKNPRDKQDPMNLATPALDPQGNAIPDVSVHRRCVEQYQQELVVGNAQAAAAQQGANPGPQATTPPGPTPAPVSRTGADLPLVSSSRYRMNMTKIADFRAQLRLVFTDEEELEDFMECLNDKDIGIIRNSGFDPEIIEQLRSMVQEDIENTSKDLQMEE